MKCLLWMMVVGVFLGGCGQVTAPRTVIPTVQTDPIQNLLNVAAGEVDGKEITVTAPVLQRDANRMLLPALSLANPDEPTPLIFVPSDAVSLKGEPLSGLATTPGGMYGVVRVTGKVEVGAEGVRAINPSETKVIAPLNLTPADLLANPATYEGQIIVVEGILILQDGSGMVVDSVGPGGVPSDNAQQVKVITTADDQVLLDRLQREPNSSVRYGNVRAVGLWSNGRMTLYWAIPVA